MQHPFQLRSGVGTPGFTCYDPTLAQRLTLAAEQAQNSAELKLRDATFSEGSAGVANAVKRLWATVGNYSASLARYIGSGGTETISNNSSGEPLTEQVTGGVARGPLSVVARCCTWTN